MNIGVFFNYTLNGPGKVVNNLIKGLEKLSINVNINEDGDSNIILQDCDRLNNDLSNCIIGPNISVLPIENKIVMDYKRYGKIIAPSIWVKGLYMQWIPEEKIIIWPVGIDTDFFNDTRKEEKKIDCLIYFKNRDKNDLNFTINILEKLNQTYEIINYGTYSEDYFLEIIKKSRYAFIIDNTESQGIAIQELMSSNLPLIVWDVTEWDYRGSKYKVPATSVPYWSNICGEIFYTSDKLEETLNVFLNKLDFYNPRVYILDNLTLEKQSKYVINQF